MHHEESRHYHLEMRQCLESNLFGVRGQKWGAVQVWN